MTSSRCDGVSCRHGAGCRVIFVQGTRRVSFKPEPAGCGKLRFDALWNQRRAADVKGELLPFRGVGGCGCNLLACTV